MPAIMKVRATVLCVRDDSVLLVGKSQSKWMLPGGKPSEDELLPETAVRELKEETALAAKGLSFQFQFVGATTIHHVFVADIGGKAKPRPHNEIKRCQWFGRDEVASTDASPTTKSIVEAHFRGR